MRKKVKYEKGITLVALVVTIIVLLLLAGITLTLVLGQNGIINKAQEAKNASINDQTATGEGFNNLYNEMSSATQTIPDRTGLKVGDYIDYSYDIAGAYTSPSTENGYSNQSIPQTTGLKWRILNINKDGTVEIISTTPTSSGVTLQGALGYNNGVYIMNDICKSQYSNASLGITARNIKTEDIEGKMNAAGIAARNAFTSSKQYGQAQTYGSGYNCYPNLYANENGSGINTTTVKTNGIGISDSANKTTGTYSQATSGLTVTETYYDLNNLSTYFNNSDIYSMLLSSGNYWIASRFAICYSDHSYFGLRIVNNSELYGYGMISSVIAITSNTFDLRPVISLGINIKTSGGTGTSDNPWKISI